MDENKPRSPKINLSALKNLSETEEPMEPVIDEIENTIDQLYEEPTEAIEVKPISLDETAPEAVVDDVVETVEEVVSEPVEPTEPMLSEIESSIEEAYDEPDKTLEIEPITIEEAEEAVADSTEVSADTNDAPVDVMDISDYAFTNDEPVQVMDVYDEEPTEEPVEEAVADPVEEQPAEEAQPVVDETPTTAVEETAAPEEIVEEEECKTFDPAKFKKEPKPAPTPIPEDFVTDYDEEATVGTKKKKKKSHWLLKTVFILFLLIAFFLCSTVGTYVFYLQYTYRPADELEEVDISRTKMWYVKTGKEYTMLTYDIGYGSNIPEYSSYVDGGTMVALEDETIMRNNIDNMKEMLKKQNVDFYLLQEVDTASTRSFMMDQNEEFGNTFSRYSKTHVEDKHTRYLFWPYDNQVGVTTSGTDFYSLYHLSHSYRKPIPSTTSFLKKFADYDRCVAINYLSMSNADAYLVIINVNLYGSDEEALSEEQWKAIYAIMEEEYNDGNYVIVGGVFNKNLTGDVFGSTESAPSWLGSLDQASLPEHYSVVKPDNSKTTSTYYNAKDPFQWGHNFESVIDGFIVSDNITASATVVDTQFAYSNHNPVKLTFKLNKKSTK